MDEERETAQLNTLRWLLMPSAVLAGWIGAAYIFGDASRTSTPSFTAAREIGSMPAWGCLFAMGATALMIACISGNLKHMSIALFAGGAMYSWWGSLFLVTLVMGEMSTLVGPAIYYFVAFAHFAGAWRIWARQP